MRQRLVLLGVVVTCVMGLVGGLPQAGHAGFGDDTCEKVDDIGRSSDPPFGCPNGRPDVDDEPVFCVIDISFEAYEYGNGFNERAVATTTASVDSCDGPVDTSDARAHVKSLDTNDEDEDFSSRPGFAVAVAAVDIESVSWPRCRQFAHDGEVSYVESPTDGDGFVGTGRSRKAHGSCPR